VGFLDRLKKGAESVSAATSKVGVGASAGQIELANRAQKLTKVGVDTPARIDSMTATGNTDKPGGTEYDITLTVTPAVGEAYQVMINQYTYPSNPFTEGENVTVKVDPGDPQVVMIFGHA
jgi:Flp pilus assembly protein TadG